MAPERPRSHELETESREFVKKALPVAWVREDVFADYGTDLRVEIVDNGRLTGQQFLIQIKAHQKDRLRGKSARLSHSIFLLITRDLLHDRKVLMLNYLF